MPLKIRFMLLAAPLAAIAFWHAGRPRKLLILGLGGERLTPDASDALAVAICFAQRLRLDRLRSGN